jgi:putative membrane protein
LAWFEIKRFRTPLQRLALAFVVLVPLLYGGLYLWSNWDPYGKLDQIPVAVVNEDRPVTVNGQEVDAGKLFVAELRKDPIFDWHFVNRAEATRGVSDTDYYFEISVPADFSKKLASGADNRPERAKMMITLDDANGYIVGKMAQTVQSELENKISAAAVSAYFQSVFNNLERLRNGIDQAVDGAGQLRDGAGSAERGSADLASGLAQLKTGADQLAPGAQQVSDGVSAIADVVVPAANAIADALPSFSQSAADAAAAADGLAGTATQAADTVAGGANSVQGKVTALGDAHPELASDPAYPGVGAVDRSGRGAGEPGGHDGRGGEDDDRDGERARAAVGAGRAEVAVGSSWRGNEDLGAGHGREAGRLGRRAAGHGPRHRVDRRDHPARWCGAAIDGRVPTGRRPHRRRRSDPGVVG